MQPRWPETIDSPCLCPRAEASAVYITLGIEPRTSSWQSIHQLSYIPALFHLLVAQAGYCSLVYCIVAKDDLWLLALLPPHPESRDSRFVHQAQTSSQCSPQAFTKKTVPQISIHWTKFFHRKVLLFLHYGQIDSQVHVGSLQFAP